MNWSDILDSIPKNADEPIVEDQFVNPLLNALGFDGKEWIRGFSTGSGDVDFAARKNYDDGDNFLSSKTNPYLLVEVKGANIKLSEGAPQYVSARNQIKRYLLGSKCQSTQWGIITNSLHIQLFRRHGKVVVPATPSLFLNKSNIDNIVAYIKRSIENTPKALTVCLYNDKGGVGKTTTSINLAAILSVKHKRVLVVDFDPQQKDLTDSLGLKERSTKLSDCLINKSIDIHNVVQTFKHKSKTGHEIAFDIITSDSSLEEYINYDKQAKIPRGAARLRELLNSFMNSYDYILLDAPTNWTFFSQSCVYACDVVLIPTKHTNFASLKNSVKVIKEFIPEVQKNRKDGKPIALPIFFNEHKPSETSMTRANAEIIKILTIEGGTPPILDPELLPYYFPKARKGFFEGL
jgi:cellulose biosynthesis protein BcsQ